jgi:DNA-binding MarR family transcriptional regulator
MSSLSAFIHCVEEVRKITGNEIPIKQLKMLLSVLDCDQFIPMGVVARDIKTSSASATRNMQNLRKLGLIKSYIDPLDNRNRILEPTKKGLELRDTLLTILTDKQTATHKGDTHERTN